LETTATKNVFLFQHPLNRQSNNNRRKHCIFMVRLDDWPGCGSGNQCCCLHPVDGVQRVSASS